MTLALVEDRDGAGEGSSVTVALVEYFEKGNGGEFIEMLILVDSAKNLFLSDRETVLLHCWSCFQETNDSSKKGKNQGFSDLFSQCVARKIAHISLIFK